jgi:hypothetical protein
MTIGLKGSCRCGAVSFSCQTHTPQPYQRCYCSICRKTAGGGGYAINLGAVARTLKVQDSRGAIRVFRAQILQEGGACAVSTGERSFCSLCASALWLFSAERPDLVHPFASAIDSDLPIPSTTVHMMLAFKPSWVELQLRDGDALFDHYPEESLDGWHKSRGLWVN